MVDVETGGFNARTDALLEIAAVMLRLDAEGNLRRGETYAFHVLPFAGANLDPAALQVTGIDPHHPLRPAIPERDALQRVFREVRNEMKAANCNRAVLVGHNAHFDLGFLNEAIARCDIKRSPFHPFAIFDTAVAGRCRPGPDGARPRLDGCRPRLGRARGSFCRLRRGDHGRPVLRDRQPVSADLRGPAGAATGDRHRETTLPGA